MPAEYLQNTSVFLLPGRRQVTTSQGKVVEYGDSVRFRTFGPPCPFVLNAAARPASRRRVSGKCLHEAVIVQSSRADAVHASSSLTLMRRTPRGGQPPIRLAEAHSKAAICRRILPTAAQPRIVSALHETPYLSASAPYMAMSG